MTAGLRWTDEQLREYNERRSAAPSSSRVSAPTRPFGRMNKTEARYAEKLALAKTSEDVTDFRFEAIKLRLADNTHFTPDFMVMRRYGGIGFDEVKGGFIREDAWLKLKIAAEQYPMFVFRLAQWKGRQWTVRTLGGRFA